MEWSGGFIVSIGSTGCEPAQEMHSRLISSRPMRSAIRATNRRRISLPRIAPPEGPSSRIAVGAVTGSGSPNVVHTGPNTRQNGELDRPETSSRTSAPARAAHSHGSCHGKGRKRHPRHSLMTLYARHVSGGGGTP